jgi:hypothetical protein
MWQPGDPVLSAADADERALWRHYRTLKLQRVRRGGLRRIDYYVAPAAAAVINGLRFEKRGNDASSIINRIIAEWAERDESFSFQPTLCDMRTNSQTKPV